mmetsp:Transcript_1042/g.3159  ORF Transcript_1042/g.3159 Transcript_1042/m.3159 type:complete len:216 (-) Transcript_1042:2823-3470(-)
MLLLEGQREAVDDGAQDFEQLRHPVVPLSLVHKPVEHMVDGPPYIRPVHHEFAIYTVEDGLQVVPLAGVLAVKQLQNADHEGLVNIFLGRFGVRVLAHHVPKQELVYYLQVGPSGLQGGLLLVRVVVLLIRSPRRRQRAEQVRRQHENDVLRHQLCELARARVYIVHQLQQCLPLHLLLPHIGCRVCEVECEGTEVQLTNKQQLLLRGRHLPERW